jgi:hypothetical protein
MSSNLSSIASMNGPSASGQAVAITADWHGHSVRPDITSVPLENVEPSHVVLATRAGDRSRLVAAFRKLAEAHLTCSAGED